MIIMKIGIYQKPKQTNRHLHKFKWKSHKWSSQKKSIVLQIRMKVWKILYIHSKTGKHNYLTTEYTSRMTLYN